MKKNNIYKQFKDNRKSFGTVSIDETIVELIEKYNTDKSIIKDINSMYTSMNIDDLKVYEEILRKMGVEDIKSHTDIPLMHLVKDTQDTNNIVKDTTYEFKIFIGIVTVIGEAEKFANRQKLLLDAIKSTNLLDYKNKMLGIFINNCNEADLKDYQSKYSELFNNTIVQGSNKNLGAAVGRNKLIDKAKELNYDYILFIDDDSYFIDALLIQKLLYFTRQSEDIAFSGPEIVYKDHKVLYTGYNFMIDTVKDKRKSKDWVETDFVENSCLMIDLNLIGEKTVIGYYPDYKYYHEEALLSWRAWRLANKRNLAIPGARHVHLRDGGGLANKHSFYYFIRNFFYMFKDMRREKKFGFFQTLNIFTFFYLNAFGMIFQRDKLAYIPIFAKANVAGVLYFLGFKAKV